MIKRLIKESIFINEKYESFYLLGMYMTDGCIETIHGKINNRCILSSNDLEILNKISRSINNTNKITRNKKTYSLKFSNQKCVKWLMSYGCVPRKSLILEIKKEIPLKYIPDFLRGCIDGDGCITIYNRRWKTNNGIIHSRKRLEVSLSSASLKFIMQIKNIIPPQFQGKIFSHNNMHRIYFIDRSAQKFLKYVYYSKSKLSMKRKYNKAKEALQLHFGRRFRTCEEKQNILHLKKMNYTLSQIASKTKVPYGTVRRIILNNS